MEEQKNSSEIINNDSQYLSEISAYPLLTAEEELELGRLASEGNEKESEEAKGRLIESNLRLVVTFARKYVGRGVALPDLIQEGNIGLLKAVERYDYTLGYRFSTYAAWWIKQCILKAIADQSRSIRIPAHQLEALNRVLASQKRLMVSLGREPSDNEIADDVNMPADRVRDYLNLEKSLVSIDAQIGDDDGSTLGDVVSDDKVPSPEEELEETFLHDEITEALNQLNEREKRIIALRFGLEDGKIHTLEDVSKEFSITKERVRQLEFNAVRKLRQHDNINSLRDYLK